MRYPHALLVALFLASSLLALACGDEQGQDNDTCQGEGCGGPDVQDLGDTANVDAGDTGKADSTQPDTLVEDLPDAGDTAVDTQTEDLGVDSVDTAIDTHGTDAADTGTPTCGYGSIHGRVCSPNGSDWLSDVEVSVRAIDCDGNPVVIQDFTDGNGFYTLDNVPSGLHSITIRTGSYTTSIDNVKVDANKTTDLTGALTKTCLDRRSASIAVFTGTYDHVEQILDNLGIIYQLYEGDTSNNDPTRPAPQAPCQHDSGAMCPRNVEMLLDINELLTYDILFINCGGEWPFIFSRYTDAQIQQMHQNLVTFVQSGGSFYASDWAYYWADLAFPTAITFMDDPTDPLYGAMKGDMDDNVVANVVSEPFRNALGGVDTMTIKFNVPSWVVAESVAFSSIVHIVAPSISADGSLLANIPLVISHQPSPTAGTLFFTSFHNEAQLTSQMEQVLRFLVFQL